VLTILLLDRFDLPTCRRDSRSLDLTSRRTVDELAGRTVWSVSCLPAGRESAERLMRRLSWTLADGVNAGWIELAADVDVAELTRVMPEDLVVLHDPSAAALARPARERRAHVVSRTGPTEPPGGHPSPVDAYLMAWGRHVAALMPAPALMRLKEMERDTYDDLGWGSLLADIVRSDRDERVGGTRHPRPTVAPR
jgi:hypothetical protein